MTDQLGRAIAPAPAPAAKRYARQARRRGVRVDVVTVLAWVSVAMAVAIFLATGGLAKFDSLGGVLTELGIICGLVATDTCVLMLLLAARIPYVDRAIGMDRAIAYHRSLGSYTVVGLCLHALFLILGYAFRDGITPVAEFLSMLSVQDLLLGVLGLVGLILVGVSSYHVAKRKLGQEAWHAVHLLSYAAVLASLPHQFSQGLFADNTPMRWYWLGLFVATGFALLTFRILLPIITTVTHAPVVTRVVPEGPGTVSIEMRGRKIDELDARAGQYFVWRFLAPGLWWHEHPFSLSAAPSGNTLRITVRNLGRGTEVLQNVKVGTRVAVEGPYGLFSDAARTTHKALVMVAAGIGIAPIRAILEETEFVPGATTIILRASTPDELYLVDEIDQLCRVKGADLYVAVGKRGRAWNGSSWLPAAWHGHSLATLAPQVATADIYVCGPRAWTDAVIADALAAGAKPNRIHDERFSW